MSRNPLVREVMDAAFAQLEGQGVLLEFATFEDRERFRWRCYSVMSAEARSSRRELDPTSVGWGRHPWPNVSVKRQEKLKLWIGKDKDIKVTMGVTQEAED